jgi:mono/diheme cytochrome c family protein
MSVTLGWRALTAAGVAVFVAACGGGGGSSGGADAAPDLALGKRAYVGACSMCHGVDLRGTSRGPSQLSKVYEPSHHPDEAYRAAVKNGVRAHHWNFGDMPSLPELPDKYVTAIIAYIRSEQQKQGFEPYPP